jgi:hypothetical protein
MQDISPSDKLAFDVMRWLNMHRDMRSHYYVTTYGILEMKWGKMAWEYQYIEPQQLPWDT